MWLQGWVCVCVGAQKIPSLPYGAPAVGSAVCGSPLAHRRRDGMRSPKRCAGQIHLTHRLCLAFLGLDGPTRENWEQVNHRPLKLAIAQHART
jgi:hypothetical protein